MLELSPPDTSTTHQRTHRRRAAGGGRGDRCRHRSRRSHRRPRASTDPSRRVADHCTDTNDRVRSDERHLDGCAGRRPSSPRVVPRGRRRRRRPAGARQHLGRRRATRAAPRPRPRGCACRATARSRTPATSSGRADEKGVPGLGEEPPVSEDLVAPVIRYDFDRHGTMRRGRAVDIVSADDPVLETVLHWHWREWSLGTEAERDEWRRRLRSRTGESGIPFTLLARWGGEPVGSISVCIDDVDAECVDRGPWLSGVYVLGAARDLGLGRRLLDVAARRAREAGATELGCHGEAISFDERCGHEWRPRRRGRRRVLWCSLS